MLSTLNRQLLAAACIGLSFLSCPTFAQQRPDVRGRGGPRAPFGFGSNGPLELLMRSDVQVELELVDDQKNNVRKLAEKHNEQRRQILTGFAEQFRNRDAVPEADRPALFSKLQEALRAMNDETEQGLSFLLPHQRKRLGQLEIQFRMRGGGGLGALASTEVGEQLEVTDVQREKLREKAMELGRDFGKKVAELRREMQEKLMAELTPLQRAKFEVMVGDPFEFQDFPPGGGLGRGQAGN